MRERVCEGGRVGERERVRERERMSEMVREGGREGERERVREREGAHHTITYTHQTITQVLTISPYGMTRHWNTAINSLSFLQ